MRKSTITGVLAASVLALTGCSSNEQPADLTPGHGTPPPPSAIAPADGSGHGDQKVNTDLQFAQQMLTHHEVEKQLLEVALKNSQNEQVRSLAESMEAERGAQIDKIRAWLKAQGQSGVAPEDVGAGEDSLMPGTEVEKALAKMEEAQQGQFAPLWVDAMITHHEAVIEMARIELEKGSSPELKGAAEHILTTRETELGELEKLRESL